MTTDATDKPKDSPPLGLSLRDGLGLAPERAPVDWHGLGLSWALADSFASTVDTVEWTADDIARAFEAGAKAAELRAKKRLMSMNDAVAGRHNYYDHAAVVLFGPNAE